VLLEKQRVSLEELESQVALELPEREMLALVTIVITNVLNNLSIDIDVNNNRVAVQVCAVVQALNSITTVDHFTCTIQQ
jgi:hypothetical protein